MKISYLVSSALIFCKTSWLGVHTWKLYTQPPELSRPNTSVTRHDTNINKVTNIVSIRLPAEYVQNCHNQGYSILEWVTMATMHIDCCQSVPNTVHGGSTLWYQDDQLVSTVSQGNPFNSQYLTSKKNTHLLLTG